jgi:hypothetical protein
VQDRQAVIAAEHWERFVRAVIPKVHDKVIWCEVGHAINRVKWGVWTAKEYRKLFMAVYNAAKKYPHLKLIAPAVIDFEWYRIVDALRCLPRNISLYAVSQHLYVDRRGAPENVQGRYSTLEKCALSKAIAVQQKNCADRFIISEVNWPLQDTGIYSPIGSPYTAPQWFADRPGETELDYASYLIRYCAIALCSGFAHSIFVWRLSAHGFGLVDDLDNFRPRPAFYALQTWLARLHNNQFVARLPSPSHCYLLHFKGAVECLLAWTTEAQYVWSQPWSAVKTYSLTGEILSLPDADVILTPQPIYICKES